MVILLLIIVLWMGMKYTADYQMNYYHENSHARTCDLYNGTITEREIGVWDGKVTCSYSEGTQQNITYFYSWQETIMYHLKALTEFAWYFGLFLIVGVYLVISL